MERGPSRILLLNMWEEEANAMEKRRRKMGLWESPPLSPTIKKRIGDESPGERESKRRGLGRE